MYTPCSWSPKAGIIDSSNYTDEHTASLVSLNSLQAELIEQSKYLTVFA